jgi:hypothetical protein
MFYRYNTVTAALLTFQTREQADAAMAPDMPAFSTEEELQACEAIRPKDLVNIYNMFAEKPVKRFETRADGVRRAWAVMTTEEEPTQSEGKADPEVKPAPVTEPTDEGMVPPPAPPKPRGRAKGTGKYADKRVFALKETNPRRAGTHGYDSYQIILGKKEGVPYPEFIKAGGRPNDLQWDIDRKNAEVR